jgi:hypothetical protein
MSTSGILYLEQLVPIESPHLEPRLAHQAQEPRKVNNLTLIDGKTFLATNVAGDIVPPGAPDVGFTKTHGFSRILNSSSTATGEQYSRQRTRLLVPRKGQSPFCRAFQCLFQITRASFAGRRVTAQLLEPPCTDPYARWCAQGQRATAAPMPIKPRSLDHVECCTTCQF